MRGANAGTAARWEIRAASIVRPYRDRRMAAAGSRAGLRLSERLGVRGEELELASETRARLELR
jgi:hypothetical protein